MANDIVCFDTLSSDNNLVFFKPVCLGASLFINDNLPFFRSLLPGKQKSLLGFLFARLIRFWLFWLVPKLIWVIIPLIIYNYR